MKTSLSLNRRRRASGFTILEASLAGTLFVLALGSILALFTYGLKSFSIMGNYVDLDMKSRNAVDIISREIRNSSELTGYDNTGFIYRLKLTNSASGMTNMLVYNSNLRTLVLHKKGQSAQTLLTGCDSFTFSLFNRAPKLSSTNITFYGSTNGAGTVDAQYCKLINMSWKCSRTILGSKLTTESVQTAQIVLRNKVK